MKEEGGKRSVALQRAEHDLDYGFWGMGEETRKEIHSPSKAAWVSLYSARRAAFSSSIAVDSALR
jgi:hypothetical protein